MDSAVVRAGPPEWMEMEGAKDNRAQRGPYNDSRVGMVITVRGNR